MGNFMIIITVVLMVTIPILIIIDFNLDLQ